MTEKPKHSQFFHKGVITIAVKHLDNLELYHGTILSTFTFNNVIC
jgi:hypothetical protein